MRTVWVSLLWCMLCRDVIITRSGEQWRQINLSRKLACLSHQNAGCGTAGSKVSQPQYMYPYCCACSGWKQQT